MRRLKSVVVAGVAAALLASVAVTGGTAGAQGSNGGKGTKDPYIFGNVEAAGESSLAQPQFHDGALLAQAHLEKAGYDVNYERLPAGAINAALAEQAFLQSAEKNPDAMFGLTSSNVFIPVGPKVAATDIPFIALSSPSEGVKNGPSGGDNIFIIRPLNEQTYSKVLEFICTDLKKQLKLKEVKLSLNLVQTAFGPTVQRVVDREIGDYKNCEVVHTSANSATATDLTQQVLSTKESGANVIMSANFPAPSGVFVNQLRQNGVNIPFVGGASLNIAVESGSIQNLDNLWASDDCVPELEKDKKAKKFVKAYTAEYGYPPNYAAAQVYDLMQFLTKTIETAGHDHKAIIEGLSKLDYDGVCDFKNDENNVLATSVTVYKYKSPTDKTKVLEKKYPVGVVDEEALTAPSTTVPTTAPAG